MQYHRILSADSWSVVMEGKHRLWTQIRGLLSRNPKPPGSDLGEPSLKAGYGFVLHSLGPLDLVRLGSHSHDDRGQMHRELQLANGFCLAIGVSCNRRFYKVGIPTPQASTSLARFRSILYARTARAHDTLSDDWGTRSLGTARSMEAPSEPNIILSI